MKTLKTIWVITAIVSSVGSLVLIGFSISKPELHLVQFLINVMFKLMAITSILPAITFFSQLAYQGDFSHMSSSLVCEVSIKIISLVMAISFLGVFSIVIPIPFLANMHAFPVGQLPIHNIVISAVVGIIGVLAIRKSGAVL
ncbi:MAG: hypothetical protein K9M36_01750 [Candidatus Pacebacteria bacterium]|nr:hypothetical protein [Candidatus Paceibacterota bacterium]